MELFSMLAKLTLDASEFESKLKAAEQEASSFDIGDHTLDLDPSGFTEGIADAQEAADGFTPPDEDNNLNMDESNFTEGVDTAQDSADSFTPPEEDHELKLDATDFTDNLASAQEEGTSFGSIMSEVFENVKVALVTTGIVGLVGQFVGFLKQGVALAGQNGDAIDKQSQKLHLSAEAYQEWNYALGLSGASVADLTRAMRNFDEIQGGKITDDQSKYFEQLGISATDAAGNMKSAQDLMEETLYALADYNGNDRGLITEAFFGRNSAGLNALLNSTSDEIKEMKQEANDLGLVMSDEDVKNAAAYMDATSRLEQAVQGLQTALGETLLPFLTDAANTLATIVAFFNPRTHQDNSLSKMAEETDKELSSNLASIEGTALAASDLVDKLFSMGDAEKLTAEQSAEWKSTAEWLVKNIPSLSGVIDTDTQSINGNKDAIMENIKQWQRYQTERAIADAKEKKLNAMMEENADAIDKMAQARAKGNDALAKQNEIVSAANSLLADDKNANLANVFEGAFGTTEIDKNAENLWDMIDWLRNVGYEFGDTSGISDLVEEYNKLKGEQSSLETESSAAQEQLDKAQQDYQAWEQAIDELFGTEKESADGTKDAVNNVKSAVEGLASAIATVPSQISIDVLLNYMSGENTHSHAIGSAYIPYDNYPAILHRGEQVLTATEARQQNNIDLSGLEDRIEAAIRNGMEGTTVRTYLNGKDITDEVNRNNTNSVKAMRYRV